MIKEKKRSNLQQDMAYFLLPGWSSKLTSFTILLVFLLYCSSFTSTGAYDPLDPNGNITIKWDVMSWTPDGYVAVVSIYNFQKYRHIQSPGWELGWRWAGREVIWSMMGSQTTEQGDCSRFKGNIPHCCKRDPIVVDLLPGTPYNQQVENCCKGGVLSPWFQDRANALSSFQISVGIAGISNKTVRVPKNFTLKAPGPGYICGPAKIVRPSIFVTPDQRRVYQALSNDMECDLHVFEFLSKKPPTCCVSLSSNKKALSACPKCACGCQNNTTQHGTCVHRNSPHLSYSSTPLVQCTSHMCPIQVHWHVKANYKEYWRVKITITNFSYKMNYTQWNLAIQHPNFNNLAQIFGFNYKYLASNGAINDTAMLWGIKFYNDLLMQAGPLGHVEAELLFRKDKSTATFEKGWAFPRRVLFNGGNCVMPSPLK